MLGVVARCAGRCAGRRLSRHAANLAQQSQGPVAFLVVCRFRTDQEAVWGGSVSQLRRGLFSQMQTRITGTYRELIASVAHVI